MATATIVTAAASRPYPGESENGDAWAIDWHDGSCRIAVIDGLGHGPAAAAAAALAVQSLHAHPDLDPVAALMRCHAALAGTRGAVVSVARIDATHSRLTYAGIGNIEAQLWQPRRTERPIAYRGIVGVHNRSVRSFDFPLEHEWLLLLHTDGISTRLSLDGLLPVPPDQLRALAEALLQRWARLDDDATIVVACPAAT